MRAAILEMPGQPFVIADDVEIEDPRVGEVRVRVSHCGVCHSDLSMVNGSFPGLTPVILGHEVAAHHPELGPVLVYACWGCRRPDCWACSPLSLRSSQWSTQRLPPAPREPSAGTQHNW